MENVSTRCVCGYEFDTIPAHEKFSDISKAEIPSNGITSKDTPSGIEIVIPAKQSVFIFLIFGLGIIIWAIGEVLAIWSFIIIGKVQNLSDSEILLLFFFGAWTVAGSFMVYAWLWNHRGKEHIVLTHSTLTIRKVIYGDGHKRVYDLNRVNNLCMSPREWEEYGWFWGGSIIFDYGSDTFKFGVSANETEAQFIVNELYKRHRFRAG